MDAGLQALTSERDEWLEAYRAWKEETLSLIDAEKLEVSDVEAALVIKLSSLSRNLLFASINRWVS